jgi:hypothetical protein
MNTDGLFAIVAMAAAACFAGLIAIQYMEYTYYVDPTTVSAPVDVWK